MTVPSNVSGTYKGSWSTLQSHIASDAMAVLKESKGTIAFQLKAVPSSHKEVLDIEVCALYCCFMARLGNISRLSCQELS